MSERVPVCEPYLWGNEKQYINEALDSGWISSAGKYLARFEDGFANYCGVEHGVAVANGTVALHLALLAAGIGPGDEVITADFTMFSPVQAIIQCGATPVFIDADPDTWTIDPALVETRITPRTRALLAVHIYGHPCDMDALSEIARRHGIALIEDAAEAHGATVNERRCGSLSDLACFSFYANKIITTGEGGMVVTNDANMASEMRRYRNLCFGTGPRRFLHEDFGYNYRMTNLQAALGCAQLEHIDAAIARKRAIATRYNELLAKIPGIVLPVEADWATNVYWVYGIVLTPEFGIGRDALAGYLADHGIETRPFFVSMHDQPVLKTRLRPGEPLPVAQRLSNNGLYLPSFMHMSADTIERVAATIREAHEHT